MTEAAAISCDSVSVAFGEGADRLLAVDNVPLEVRRGEIHCLIGPSGCGKSTLLNAVAGPLETEAGAIEVLGQKVTAGPTGKIGYMTQKDTLLPWFTSLRNVRLPLEAVGRTGEAGKTAEPSRAGRPVRF